MTTGVRTALLRTLAFHRTWDHAPTRAEWIATLDAGGGGTVPRADVILEISALVGSGAVLCHAGRHAFPSDGPAFVERIRGNEPWAARKYRAARNAARWLARFGSVRFVALCNTAALGHARDDGDVDFFVVTRRNVVSATRVLSALLFEILGRRPAPGRGRDAVCLSYFVTEDGLDLSPHMLEPDDPYFRHWFLSFVPLYDDGAGRALWDANKRITSRHPFCRQWIVPPDLRVGFPRSRIPVPNAFESMAARLQIKAFPDAIRRLMNADTRVVVGPTALKFHVDDRRNDHRKRYAAFCAGLGVSV